MTSFYDHDVSDALALLEKTVPLDDIRKIMEREPDLFQNYVRTLACCRR